MTRSQSQEDHIKRLEWAIWLSQVNLAEFREGDWLNLQQDFKAYIARSFTASIAGVFQLPKKFVESQVASLARKEQQSDLEKLQSAIRDDLRKVAYSGEDEPSEMFPLSTLEMKNVSVSVKGYGPDEPFQLDISTEAVTGVMIQRTLYEDLVGSGILRRQLRSCPLCKRIFLLKRMPRSDMRFHCSLKCSRLAATRRYRDKKRKRSHRRTPAPLKRRGGDKDAIRK
jgi:hypothetical protein